MLNSKALKTTDVKTTCFDQSGLSRGSRTEGDEHAAREAFRPWAFITFVCCLFLLMNNFFRF